MHRIIKLGALNRNTTISKLADLIIKNYFKNDTKQN